MAAMNTITIDFTVLRTAKDKAWLVRHVAKLLGGSVSLGVSSYGDSVRHRAHAEFTEVPLCTQCGAPQEDT